MSDSENQFRDPERVALIESVAAKTWDQIRVRSEM